MIWPLLAIAAVTDLLCRKIFNAWVIIALAIGLWQATDPLQAALWGAVATAVALIPYAGADIGGGDVKLAAVLGVFLGQFGVVVFVVGLMVTWLYAASVERSMPLAPFMLGSFALLSVI